MDEYYTRTRGTWRRPQNGNTHRLTQNNTKKNIKLENARPWWNTWILVQEIHLHSRQTSTRNEQMPTRNTNTWLDDQRKDYINPNESEQKNCSKQLQTDNLPTNDVLKILTAQIREKIYYSLTSRGLFPDGQKGFRKGSRHTAELHYIDQHILNETRTKRKNLAMAWIDNKKAYDMVPQSWIIHCLKIYKISYEVINFIEKTMQTWRVKLTAGRSSLAETKIQRGIFQGDALSPLLFIIVMMPHDHILRKCIAGYKLSRSQEKIIHLMYMDDIKLFAKNEKELETLIHAVRIYSQDIGMEFSIEKCAMFVMKSGKWHISDGMELPNHDKIRTLGENETYRYKY